MEERSVSSTQDAGNQQADELMAEGRRAMACKEYNQAVFAFQEACELLSTKYGQISEELGEPTFLYGKALLELARMENALFGSNVPVPSQAEEEEESDDDDDEEEEEGYEKSKQSSDHAPSEAKAGSSSGCAPPADIGMTNEQIAGEKEPAAGEKEATTADEDPTSLQLAWEIFEVARVIFEKAETLEGRLKLADINLLLGEVSLESDQFERAIDDITACLKIREFVLKADDRLLAEAHFQLGLACTFAMNFDAAISEYEAAKQVLALRKEILQGQLEKSGGENEAERLKEEISELDELLPDMDSKINDVCELQKKQEVIRETALEEEDTRQQIAVTTLDEQPSTPTFTAEKSDLPVSDISHLVRKKVKVNGKRDETEGSCVSSTGDNNPSRKRSIADETDAERPPFKQIHLDTTKTGSCNISTEQ